MGALRDIWPLVNVAFAVSVVIAVWHASNLRALSSTPRARLGCSLILIGVSADALRIIVKVYEMQVLRSESPGPIPPFLVDLHILVLPAVTSLCLLVGTFVLTSLAARKGGWS